MNIDELKADYEKVGTYAREIIAKRMAAMQALSVILALAVSLGAVDVHVSGKIVGLVVVGFNTLTTLVGVLWSRDATTPADPKLNPTSVAGAALTPDVEPTGKHSEQVVLSSISQLSTNDLALHSIV